MARRIRSGRKYLFLGVALLIILAGAFAFNVGDVRTKFDIQLSPEVYTASLLQACEARHSEIAYIDITTCEGLKGIDNGLNGNYRLMNDLDCSFEPIAFGEGEFKGIFDGQGYTVAYSFDSDTHGKVGLFSDVGECGIIKDLHVDADMRGTSSVGAIAGYVYKGILKEVYSTGSVKANTQDAGGLVGGLKSGGVLDSYSEAAVSGNERVGGLVGAAWNFPNNEQRPIIKNSYANGNVLSEGNNVGGLAGLCDYPAISSYWNLDVFGFDNGCGVGKTDIEMKQQGTFLGWDFTNVWRIDSGDYPRLQWQQQENCIEIWTAEDLDNVRNDLDACYTQMADINLTDYDLQPIGLIFTGSYNGMNHVIYGFKYVNLTRSLVGLFSQVGGNTEETVLKNIRLDNLNIHAGQKVGGLVGQSAGNLKIENVHVSGNVRATEAFAGGLVGISYGSIEVLRSSSSGEVISDQGEYLGGLIGYAGNSEDNLVMADSYSTAQLTGNWRVGGLIGDFITKTKITNSYFTGRIVALREDGAQIGGIVGTAASILDNGSRIVDSYSDAVFVVNESATAVGGIAGTLINITVMNSYSNTDVRGGGVVGGLVGDAFIGTIIINSHATGDVKGRSSVGGLVGDVFFAKIVNSYSTGNVQGSAWVGGLAGWAGVRSGNTEISNSYSTGNVLGGTYVGGLVGDARGSTNTKIINSYSTGNVQGDSYLGGLIGISSNGPVDLINSYWDIQTSGQTQSDGGEGRTTAQMKQQATFVNWDFSSIWDIIENQSYPWLR